MSALGMRVFTMIASVLIGYGFSRLVSVEFDSMDMYVLAFCGNLLATVSRLEAFTGVNDEKG